MEFAKEVVKAAWSRQGGRCARCGRWLVWAQRGKDNIIGTWEPHNMNRAGREGNTELADCVVFCTSLADCHFNVGHGGIDWSHHARLDTSVLPFLRSGEEMARMASKSGESGSLLGTMFGVKRVADRKRQPVQKRKSKRNTDGNREATKARSKDASMDTATDC